MVLGRPQFHCSNGKLRHSNTTVRRERGVWTQLNHYSAWRDIHVKQTILIVNSSRDVRHVRGVARRWRTFKTLAFATVIAALASVPETAVAADIFNGLIADGLPRIFLRGAARNNCYSRMPVATSHRNIAPPDSPSLQAVVASGSQS